MKEYIYKKYENIKFMFCWLLKQIPTAICHGIFVSVLFVSALFISILVYSWFYSWYMPVAQIKRPISFELHQYQYSISSFQIMTTDHKPLLMKSYQNELVGNVDIFGGFSTVIETLHYGQEYSISLELKVSESDQNFDIGIFGISVEIIDVEGKKQNEYKTLATLIYKSVLLRYLTTFFNYPLYIIGFYQQIQSLKVPIKDNYIDNAVNL
jgi:hypothetical protein